MIDVHYFKRLQLSKEFAPTLALEGFTRKGAAFYRMNSDSVLIAVTFTFSRILDHFELSFGAFSMYADLPKDFLSTIQFICPHNAMHLVGKQNAAKIEFTGNIAYIDKNNLSVTPEKQFDVFLRSALPLLKALKTQEDLVKFYWEMEERLYTIGLWNNIQKLEPYLFMEDHDSAKRCLTHFLGTGFTRGIELTYDSTPESFQSLQAKFPPGYHYWLNIYKLLVDENYAAVKEILAANLSRNLQRIKTQLKIKPQ